MGNNCSFTPGADCVGQMRMRNFVLKIAAPSGGASGLRSGRVTSPIFQKVGCQVWVAYSGLIGTVNPIFIFRRVTHSRLFLA